MFINFYCLNYRGLETLQVNRRASLFFQTVNLGEMVMCLEDLINYFAQPGEEMGMLFSFPNLKQYNVIITISKNYVARKEIEQHLPGYCL